MWQTVLFAIGCVVALGVAMMSARKRRNLDAVFMALLFLGTFIESNVAYYALGGLVSYKLQPLDDVVAAFVAFILLHERFEDWKLGIVFLAALKMTATAVFWWSGGAAMGAHATHVYELSIQAGFAIQLSVVALSGVTGAGALAFGDWALHRLWGAVAHASPAGVRSKTVRH